MIKIFTLASVVGLAAAATQCGDHTCATSDAVRAQEVSKQPASFDSPTYSRYD